MNTVILCGGQGTRLREKTAHIPKPLVEVGPRPIVWHVMKIYASQGSSEFVLCLGYKGDLIKRSLGALVETARPSVPVVERGLSPSEGWNVRFVDTGEGTDTGGRLHRVREHVGDGTFALTYADGVADVDLPALLRFHREHGKIATVTAVRRRLDLGVLQISDDDTVTHIAEKPISESFFNGGFFVFEPEVFELTTPSCSLEVDVLPRLAEAGSSGRSATRAFGRAWTPTRT